jgi:hypothetical protein
MKAKTTDLYYCPRCKKDSLKSEHVPCPRGSCEARIEGTVTTTVTVSKTLTKEQQDWNKKNYR